MNNEEWKKDLRGEITIRLEYADVPREKRHVAVNSIENMIKEIITSHDAEMEKRVVEELEEMKLQETNLGEYDPDGAYLGYFNKALSDAIEVIKGVYKKQ